MDAQDPKLREVWKQKSIPVIYRQPSLKPVLLRIPYAPNNFEWVRGEKHRMPGWNVKLQCWEVPVSWFDKLVERTLRQFGKIYVIQLYKENQKCAPACWNAQGFHCECSCMGANHGSGHPGGHWHEVSETFALQWGPRKYSCRLIAANTAD